MLILDRQLLGIHPEVMTYLSAVQRWPHDYSGSQHWQYLRACLNSAVQITLNEGGASRLRQEVVYAAAAGERLNEISLPEMQSKAGEERGLLAAFLLLHTLAQGDEGSLENAITALSTAAGRKISVSGRSRAALHAVWRTFKPAVHLCAVRLVLPSLWREAVEDPLDPVKLRAFLAAAERLRKAGEAHRAPGADGPLLNPAKSWRVPDSLLLPEIAPLSDWLPSVEQLEELAAAPLRTS